MSIGRQSTDNETYETNNGNVAQTMLVTLLVGSGFFIILEIFVDIYNTYVNLLFVGFFVLYTFCIPAIIIDYKKTHGIISKVDWCIPVARKVLLLILFNCLLAFFAQETKSYSLIDIWNALFGTKNTLHFGLDTLHRYLLIIHNPMEVVYINIVGLVYVVYLIDEYFSTSIIGRCLGVIIYSWTLSSFNLHGRFMEVILSGFGAAIAAILLSFIIISILKFIFSKHFIDLLGFYNLKSKYDEQKEKVEDLERFRDDVSSNNKLSRSFQNDLIGKADRKIEEEKKKLESKKEELDNYFNKCENGR